MSRHDKFINLAMQIAYKSEGMGNSKSKHCAIITRGKNIVAVGINSRDTHPEMFKNDKDKIFLHAEMSAMLASRYSDISNCTIYIVRSSPTGRNYSRPCNICMKNILMRGIKNMVYSNNEDGYIVERISHTHNRIIENGKIRKGYAVQDKSCKQNKSVGICQHIQHQEGKRTKTLLGRTIYN